MINQRGVCQRWRERGARRPRDLHGCGLHVGVPDGCAMHVILPREVHNRCSDRPQQSGSRDVALEFTTGRDLAQRQHGIPCDAGAVDSA